MNETAANLAMLYVIATFLIVAICARMVSCILNGGLSYRGAKPLYAQQSKSKRVRYSVRVRG